MGRKFKITVFSLLIGVLCFWSCETKQPIQEERVSIENPHFSIQEKEDHFILKVINPYPGADLTETYVLYRRGEAKPKYDGITHFIEIPVKSVAITSTTHLGYIEKLDRIEVVKGANNLDYFYSTDFKKSIESGDVASLGNREFDTESLIQQEVDLVFAYAIDAKGFKRIEQYRNLDQKVVLIAEYLEKDPLIKAEWLKVFAALTGDLDQADQQHQALVKRYDSLKATVQNKTALPSIVMGFPWKGTWYVSGGKSFQAQLFADASGAYLWKDDQNESGVPLDMEVVLQKAIDADFWINVNALRSFQQISEADERFSSLKAFQNKNVFNNDKRLNEIGGNDYWESAVVRPDLVLADLIEILHGEGRESKLYYYRRIKDE